MTSPRFSYHYTFGQRVVSQNQIVSYKDFHFHPDTITLRTIANLLFVRN